MGNCWAWCCGVFRKETNRIQRGGGSKYFRTSSTGEHFTIEFENLVESDEGESPGSSQRVLSEDEIVHLKEQRYNAITDKQKAVDEKLKSEQRFQKGRVKRETGGGADHHKSLAAGEDFETYLQNVRAQSEAFRSSRVSSEANEATPNTESSCDFTSKTRSTNDDGTSLDLEWEDEEGMNRMIPVRERSKTEEDILRAALRPASKHTGSNLTSASDDSNVLEWENDFVGVHIEENGNSEYAGFVNPVLETSFPETEISNSEKQDR
ncbi:AP-1 complex-associated regulatory protein isoform X2 [Amia ocellicauda]|uniref:AP-1 complex-associated regulatory protein isoform X2 n=1 Tax=Amia ocellicauda TaxID=2972642 RepID=UPI0034643864